MRPLRPSAASVGAASHIRPAWPATPSATAPTLLGPSVSGLPLRRRSRRVSAPRPGRRACSSLIAWRGRVAGPAGPSGSTPCWRAHRAHRDTESPGRMPSPALWADAGCVRSRRARAGPRWPNRVATLWNGIRLGGSRRRRMGLVRGAVGGDDRDAPRRCSARRVAEATPACAVPSAGAGAADRSRRGSAGVGFGRHRRRSGARTGRG